ncbi:MAG: LVIVD repeat-containing protein, partial [Candidatus Hermodarchaeota archaeon]
NSYCLAVSDNQAHVVHFTEGYNLINISNPYNPNILSTYTDLAEYCYQHEIAVKGNLAYITNEIEGLLVLDVSNPLNVTKVTQLQIEDSETEEVRISGNYIIVVNQVSWYNPTYKISIYNNTNQYNPTYIGTYRSTSSNPYSIDIKDDLAFIKELVYINSTHSFKRISILNFSNPLNPFKIGEFGGLDSPRNIEFGDDLVFVADKGLRVFNISNFKNITLVGQFYDGGLGFLLDIEYSDGLIYLADGMDNLEIVGFDADKDGLADYVEDYVYYTDSGDPDTDDDGINDGDEILNDTDPKNPLDY